MVADDAVRVGQRRIGRWISIVHRHTQMHLDRRLAPYGVSSGQVGFLMQLIENDEVSQTELAARLVLDKGTTAEALARLEAAGYVVRTPDPDDRRVKRVALTAKARAFAPTLQAILKAWIDTLTREFSAEEREQASLLLQRMATNAGEATADE